MTNDTENVKKEMESLKKAQEEYTTLESRYHVTLELLGEREETVRELQLDCLDLKDALRIQMLQSVQDTE